MDYQLIIIICCILRFTLSQSTDCLDLSFCILCEPKETVNRQCQLCKYGYGPSNGKCIQCQINGCFNCDTIDICLDCGPGQGVSMDGLSCIPCTNLENCVDCYFSYSCLQCNTGFYLSEGKCLKCLEIPGCSFCETTDRCAQCSNGQGLNDLAQCQPCIGSSCVDCLVSSICILCKAGYYLQNGRCYSLC